MHSKTKKRTRRKATKKVVKSVADLPLCYIYISAVVFLEALLVVMVVLSSTSEKNYNVKQYQFAKTQAYEANVIDKKERKERENLSKNGEFAEPIKEQVEPRRSIPIAKTEESFVESEKDNLAEIDISNQTNIEEKSLKNDNNSIYIAKENTVKAKKSKEDTSKDSTMKKGSNVVETEEISSKYEFSTQEEATKDGSVVDNISDETQISDIKQECSIPSVEVTEEIAVGAEEDIIKEDIIKEANEEVLGLAESTTKEEKKSVVRSDDLELLANIMYAEEGVFIQSDPENAERAHKLCGSTVLHRMEVNFGGASTMHDVLYAKGQYASATKKRVEKGQDIPECVYKWAEELITNGPIGPSNLVYQAQFKQGEIYERVGNQYFCLSDVYEPEMQTVPEPEAVIESDSVEPQDIQDDSIIYEDMYIEEYDI